MNPVTPGWIRRRLKLMTFVVNLIDDYESRGELDQLNADVIVEQLVSSPEFEDMNPLVIEVILEGWGIY